MLVTGVQDRAGAAACPQVHELTARLCMGQPAAQAMAFWRFHHDSLFQQSRRKVGKKRRDFRLGTARAPLREGQVRQIALAEAADAAHLGYTSSSRVRPHMSAQW